MISFIIPTRNEATTIAAMLQQFRKKFNLVPYEIIVADNGSTDQTLNLARPWADQILNHTGDSTTIAATRNRGAAVAHYPYLVFMDSGVSITQPNNFFKTALNCFTTNPNLAGLTSQVKILPELASRADKIFCWLINAWYRLVNNILHSGVAYGKFQMVTAAAFTQVGGYDITLAAAEDAELFYRLAKISRTRLEPRLTVFYDGRRVHQVGWPKLLFLWISNALWVLLFRRSLNKQWKLVR